MRVSVVKHYFKHFSLTNLYQAIIGHHSDKNADQLMKTWLKTE